MRDSRSRAQASRPAPSETANPGDVPPASHLVSPRDALDFDDDLHLGHRHLNCANRFRFSQAETIFSNDTTGDDFTEGTSNLGAGRMI
jgi:hypothetical protein